MANLTVSFNFSPTDPRCHGNEIWDKMGYNSACVGDFCEIFAPVGGFLGMGHRMLPIAFFPDRPRCHGNEIWDKMGYNSVTVVIGLATVRQNLKRNIFVTDYQKENSILVIKQQI